MAGLLKEFGPIQTSVMASALELGYQTLSDNQHLVFTKYVRFILPTDGTIFWIKADQLTLPYPPGTQTVTTAPNQISVLGSFHYSTVQNQRSDNTTGINDVILTTDTEIADFNSLQPSEAYFGSYRDIQFSFSRQGNFYEESQVWHYKGQAIYPYMRSQIIDDLSTFDYTDVVVSNSLPIWLWINQNTAYPQVYPGFLVPENLTPPYIVALIEPSETMSFQPIPLVLPADPNIVGDQNGIWQLCRDRVHFVFYGMRNHEIQNWVQYVISQTWMYPKLYGILNPGFTITDSHVIQSELNVIAQQKRITLDVSYNQQAVYDLAIQYILEALPIEYHVGNL